MDLRDGMIDEERGAALAVGQMTLRPQPSAIDPSFAGSSQLFSIRRYESFLAIQRVASHSLNARGFYDTTIAFPTLTLCLPVDQLLQRWWQVKTRSIAIGGSRAGWFEYGSGNLGASKSSFSHYLDPVELTMACDGDGLTIGISGVLGEESRKPAEPTAAPIAAGSRIDLGLKLNWATVFLQMPELCWERSTIVRDMTHLVEPGTDDPYSLPGLSIDEISSEAFIPGTFSKSLDFIGGGAANSKGKLVNLSIGPQSVSFSVPNRVDRLSSGFVRGSPASWRFTFFQVGWIWLQWALQDNERAELTLQGAGLGHLQNVTGYDAAQNGGSARQPVDALRVSAQVEDAGLDIRIEGSLGEVDRRDVGDLAKYLTPRSDDRFRIAAQVPYALLVARGSSLRYQVQKRREAGGRARVSG
jgi:hypothetical protein